MLRKLENHYGNTVMELQAQFKDKWLVYGITKDDKRYAVYTADTYKELSPITPQRMEAEGYLHWGEICPEHLMPTDTQMGGIEVDYWD